jgi:hypothetical protein
MCLWKTAAEVPLAALRLARSSFLHYTLRGLKGFSVQAHTGALRAACLFSQEKPRSAEPGWYTPTLKMFYIPRLRHPPDTDS